MTRVVDERITTIANLLTPVLTALLVGGVGWLLLEVQDSRERWARVEERISAQSVLIMELRVELSDSLRDQRSGMRELERGVNGLERRVILLEANKSNATQN